MDFTLFETHLHGSTDAEAQSQADGTETRGRGRRLLTAALGPTVAATLVVAVVAGRRIRGRRAALAAERHQVEVDAVEYANGLANAAE